MGSESRDKSESAGNLEDRFPVLSLTEVDTCGERSFVNTTFVG